MLIDFTRLPIAKGQPGDLSLHWFGLTDGHYWIEVGENKLFEYSECAQTAGASRYCEYHVVRLHEDLLEMLPHRHPAGVEVSGRAKKTLARANADVQAQFRYQYSPNRYR